MSFSPERAEIRFGCGLSPVLPAATSPEALLAGLEGPDVMAAHFPVLSSEEYLPRRAQWQALRKQLRQAEGARAEALRQQVDDANRAFADLMRYGASQTVLRWSWTGQGFRERLALFWADHFTVVGKNVAQRSVVSTFVDSTIRGNMTGRFGDLLVAVTTHPMMLQYLDQQNSVGPGSRFATRGGGKQGLNENLAREVMELHTLGVDGPYSQQDVRQLAELFTGMGIGPERQFEFRPGRAEPGAETVLGRTYGGDPAQVEPIYQVLQDLAVHPATAQHIARKLAVHFVSDTPDPALVDHIAARFRATGGELRAVYAALLEHPAAWGEAPGNVKPGFDFLASACRALAVGPERFADLPAGRMNALIMVPLRQMGQGWQRPNGPNGWPEEDEAWASPQGLSARIRWAMEAPRRLCGELPDPRRFVTDALGATAPEPVRFAARAAETRAEAIGLVLSSPAFQRR